MKRILLVAVVVVVVLAGLIAWRIRAQDAVLEGPLSGSGVVESAGVDLSSRMAARVVSVAEEGATVAAGDVVMELNCDVPRAGLLEAEARLEVARSQADGAASSATAAARQRSAAQASTRAARARVSVSETRRDAARREAARVASLGDYVATATHDGARDMVLTLEQEVGSATASRVAVQRQASAAAASAESAGDQAEAASRSIAVMEAVVARARLATEECRITTPLAGVVERAYFEAGELASFGAIVARVVRTDMVRATFYVPNSEVGGVHVGQSVRVVADAFSGREFQGTVRRVGLEAEFTPRNVQTRSDRDRLVFPAEIDIVNEEASLRAGMPVTVTVGVEP